MRGNQDGAALSLVKERSHAKDCLWTGVSKIVGQVHCGIEMLDYRDSCSGEKDHSDCSYSLHG